MSREMYVSVGLIYFMLHALEKIGFKGLKIPKVKK